MSDIPDRSDTENSAIEMGDNVGPGTENAGDLVGEHHESLTEGDWRSLDEFVALRAESEPMEPHPNQRSDSENEEYYKDVDTALRERFSGGEWRGDEMDRISREPTRPLEQTNEPSEDTHRFDALTGETNHLGANDQTAPMESSQPGSSTTPSPRRQPGRRTPTGCRVSRRATSRSTPRRRSRTPCPACARTSPTAPPIASTHPPSQTCASSSATKAKTGEPAGIGRPAGRLDLTPGTPPIPSGTAGATATRC